MRIRSLHAVLALAGAAVAVPAAHGQLRQDEVLVVYDSRIAESAEVARIYAGSAKVPGGAQFEPGFRPFVRVVDLGTLGAAAPAGPTLSYADFVARLRTPIRTHLNTSGLDRTVRCIVLTKGIAHRIDDTDNAGVGDRPNANAGNFIPEFNASDVTCASVDSELTLLQIDLNTGENGGTGDSRADGLIINPYWRSVRGFGGFTAINNRAAKSFTATLVGPVWALGGAGAAQLTAGDIYLVCRLDGRTVEDVRGMLGRAQNAVYDVDQHLVLFDASASNNVADPAPDSSGAELDNIGQLASLWAGDDYEKSRDFLLQTDRRFLPANVRYNQFGNAGEFFVGPLVPYLPPFTLISGPVLLLATFGSNHGGTFPQTAEGVSARTTFADSFHYADGAIFNTIESYNGRGFGGLENQSFSPAQEQLSDFLAAGGTFGLGHVWEPLADTIPDNEFLVKNFITGTLSWAEAAWSSVPGLSWQQIVVGDPLARAVRTSEDLNGDGRISIEDLYEWEASPTDINRSGQADSADRAYLLRAIRAWERQDSLARN